MTPDSSGAAIVDLAFVKHSDTGGSWDDQFMIQHVESVGNAPSIMKTLKEELQIIEDNLWSKVTLPHTAHVEDRIVCGRQWQGICFYRKSFHVPSSSRKKRTFVSFEGAMQLADVWINGNHVFQHAGGFTPFSIDLAHTLIYDGENTIVVKLDNQDNPEIPPGKPIDKLDFNYFSGLYRGVKLVVKEPVHITDPILADTIAGGGIFVTYSDVSDKQATVTIKTHVANWCMFDHNRGHATNLSSCGNADSTRVPKPAYYFFQSQRDPVNYAPVVHIANHWDSEPAFGKVIVYSNCDEVELTLNGKVVSRQKPDDGPDTPYWPRTTR